MKCKKMQKRNSHNTVFFYYQSYQEESQWLHLNRCSISYPKRQSVKTKGVGMCFKKMFSHVTPFYINMIIVKGLWNFLVSHQPRAMQLIRYIWFFISHSQPLGYPPVITVSLRTISGYQRRTQHAICYCVFILCWLLP